MKQFTIPMFLFLFVWAAACVTKKDTSMDQKINAELTVIDSLLRNIDFSTLIAKNQDTAYYTGIGQPVPPFLTPAEETATITKSVREEKIAISLAGFYALECGVGLLSEQTKEKPTTVLERINGDKEDTAAILLLNRFANATWKAGQPFKDLEKIKRPVFMVANFLPGEEVKKDYIQVQKAAGKLLQSMAAVKDSSTHRQMTQLRSLLQSPSYALEMAAFTDAAYKDGQQQSAKPFITAEEDTATTKKSAKEEKIATNLAGFYALECGLSYLITTRDLLPSGILKSITDNSISKEDKNLFSRFANATWKAGQPFRGLSRIERETFTPFYFLSDADIDKDWVQIKAAAHLVLTKL